MRPGLLHAEALGSGLRLDGPSMLWTSLARLPGQMPGHPSADVQGGGRLPVLVPRPETIPLPWASGTASLLVSASSLSRVQVSVYKRQMHGAHPSEGCRGQTAPRHRKSPASGYLCTTPWPALEVLTSSICQL